ncbi:MAG: hypothetical protein OWQ50_02525 [Acidianus infernus]|nr:hypothetical protein [Acidianus infernus]
MAKQVVICQRKVIPELPASTIDEKLTIDAILGNSRPVLKESFSSTIANKNEM